MALFELGNGGLPLVIARNQVGKLTGGALSPKTLANLDSLGLGPRTRIKLGRRVAYPTPVLLEWLEARSTTIAALPSWEL